MRCPNCGKKTLLLETIDDSLWVKCICGKIIPVVEHKEGMTIYHVDPINDRKMPRVDTKIYSVLVTVHNLGIGTSEEIGLQLGLSSNEASTHLTLLEKKGLVERRTIKRGVKGGSSWELSNFSYDYFK